MKTSLKLVVFLYSILYCFILSAQLPDCSNPTETQGCTDATACNFDPEATCDDGSCDFAEPCCNCCPELVEVVVSGSGTYCSGDVALVCAEFAEPFTNEGEVIINGVAAIGGETQVCFDLILENKNCSIANIVMSFEVLCTIEGSSTTAFTKPISIAPDPNKWLARFNQGDCLFPPNVLNGGCFAIIEEIEVTVSPVSACPPQSGEVAITLVYYDDDFDEIDISQYPCPGFSETLTTSSVGCSECPCPAEPTIFSSDTDVCEGDMVEVCLAFAPGDEANALGVQVSIRGNMGSSYSEILASDSLSSNYCIEFTPYFSSPLECDPVTEEYTINILCNYGPVAIGLPFSTTIYPKLDKFGYYKIPAKDNCPNTATLPKVVNIGECDLDIQSAVTITPADGCPGTTGEFTYSVNYLSPADFANAPDDCAFMPVVDATEPIPACLTCPPCYGSISGAITIDDDCDGNGGDVPSQPITVELYDEGGSLIATATSSRFLFI